MQAYAEGFALMRKKEEFSIDLESVASAWCDGTVIRSWLLELLAGSLKGDPALSEVIPRVSDSGEARWALREAVDLGVPAPVLSSSLFERFGSRDDEAYAARILSVLRGAFGGHRVERRGES
jgi:6-phosphogluconate dehydrogenase